MTRIAVLRNDWSLEASATSTNQAPDGAASRMLTPAHSERWRTNNLTAMQSTFDAGEPRVWDTLFLGYTNATDAATLRITASDNSGTLFTSPTYDRLQPLRLPHSGEFIAWHAWHAATTPQTHRFIGIEIADAANPDGHFNAGIAYIGNRLAPLLEAQAEGNDGHQDLSIKLRMSNGESRARRRPRKRQRPSCAWAFLTEDEKEFFKSLSRTYGTSTPIVVKIEPDNALYQHANIIYGMTDGITVNDLEVYAMAYQGQVYRNIGSAEFGIVEV